VSIIYTRSQESRGRLVCYANVLLSFSTSCLYGFPLRTAFALAAEAGFEGVELVMGPEVWLRGTRYASSLAREYGLHIYSIHPTSLAISPQGRGTGRIRDAVIAALELDCPCVVVHVPGVGCWTDSAAQQWLRAVEDCRSQVRGSVTRLALENRGKGPKPTDPTVLGDLPALIAFAREHDLDITFDTCHAGSAHLDLLQAYDLLRTRIVNVHFSDLIPLSHGMNLGLVRAFFAHHQMPGEGDLPLAKLLSRLALERFSGAVTVEVGMVGLRAWSRGQLRCQLARIVEYVRSAFPHPKDES